MGNRLRENFENDIQAKPVADPVFTNAMKEIEKSRELKNKYTKITKAKERDLKPKNPRMVEGAKKMHLDEKLFKEIYYKEETPEEYLEDVYQGEGWVTIDKIKFDIEEYYTWLKLEDILNAAKSNGFEFYNDPDYGLLLIHENVDKNNIE